MSPACDFASSGWRCNGRGFLCIEGTETSSFACPACNTSSFLDIAYRRVAGTGAGRGCPCCRPKSLDPVWDSAVATALAVQPKVTEAWLARKRRAGSRSVFRAEAVD
jgi:hypothetical protein